MTPGKLIVPGNGSPGLDTKHAFLVRKVTPEYTQVTLGDGVEATSLVWNVEAMRPGTLKASKLVLVFPPGAEAKLVGLLGLEPIPEKDESDDEVG